MRIKIKTPIIQAILNFFSAFEFFFNVRLNGVRMSSLRLRRTNLACAKSYPIFKLQVL